MPASLPGATASAVFYLRAKDTGVWHYLAQLYYNSSGQLFGPNWTHRLVPSVYDLLYRSDYDLQTNLVGKTYPQDALPGGLRVLQSCVQLPP